MNIDDQLLEKLAKLARIKITEENKGEMKEHLSEILTWMEKLQEIDTSNVEPLTNMSPEINASREDKIGTHLERSKMLENAPDKDDKFVKVPLVKKSN